LEPWLRPAQRTGAMKLLRFSFPVTGHTIVVQAGDGSYHVEV
jgi:hypothetical protein